MSNNQLTEPKTGCIEQALAIVGNKWTALIVRELSFGTRRFSELQRATPGISPRTLSQRLDDMEGVGIVTRQTFAEVPPRVEYALTDKGSDLLPILQQMADWGYKHYDTALECDPK